MKKQAGEYMPGRKSTLAHHPQFASLDNRCFPVLKFALRFGRLVFFFAEDCAYACAPCSKTDLHGRPEVVRLSMLRLRRGALRSVAEFSYSFRREKFIVGCPL
jgi:hypothetical protein